MYQRQTDYGPDPFAADVTKSAEQNKMFRTALWTGCYLQMTLMSIPPCGEIGAEIHKDTDQVIRVEEGKAYVLMDAGACQKRYKHVLNQGDTVFIPAGTWHNIMNEENCPLKLSSIYAPPHHNHGTLQPVKTDV